VILALWFFALLGAIVLGGLLFSALHPNLQRWGEGLPNQLK